MTPETVHSSLCEKEKPSTFRLFQRQISQDTSPESNMRVNLVADNFLVQSDPYLPSPPRYNVFLPEGGPFLSDKGWGTYYRTVRVGRVLTITRKNRGPFPQHRHFWISKLYLYSIMYFFLYNQKKFCTPLQTREISLLIYEYWENVSPALATSIFNQFKY